MLTGFTWCIPIKLKKAADVARAYMQHVYSVLGGSTKILTDNGTKFKNEVFRDMLQRLGTEKLIHSPRTDHNPMEELKDSTDTSKHALLST